MIDVLKFSDNTKPTTGITKPRPIKSVSELMKVSTINHRNLVFCGVVNNLYNLEALAKAPISFIFIVCYMH
jgi:hypothetical protein